MHLLNVDTYQLERFHDERSTPPYTILSHTWMDGKEVQFADIHRYSPKGADDVLDWRKVHYTCRQTIADGFSYTWIDTCCIDKSSSAELSEAINSMFRWYQKAKICYVYMTDVGILREVANDETGEMQWPSATPNFSRKADAGSIQPSIPMTSRGLLKTLQVRQSRWFTRGWTLQELIAPGLLVFYDCNWKLLGSRETLLPDIRAATGVPETALSPAIPLQEFGIAVRMSWASQRRTTRIEDEAYCLLGIFDINMPLLYGEGPKAFLRLQEEILKVTTDQTIFAWNGIESQLFAPSTANFAHSSSIVPRNRPAPGDVHEMTNRGCRISLLFSPPLESHASYGTVVLDCIDERSPFSDILLSLAIADRTASDVLEAEPASHTLRYYPHADRFSRRANGKYIPFAKQQLLILRNSQYRSRASSTAMKFSLANDEKSLHFQLFPCTIWDRLTSCCTVKSGLGYERTPLAVWIGPKSAAEPHKSARAFRRSSNEHGVMLVWRWDASTHPPKIRIAHCKCKHSDAHDTAGFLLERMEASTPLNSHFSRRWHDDRLPPDQILTYLWHGIRITFHAQPIGVNRDGIMIVAQREPTISQRLGVQVSQVLQWLFSHSAIFRVLFCSLAALCCFCAIVDIPGQYRKKAKRRIKAVRHWASMAWGNISRKGSARRKEEEAEVGLENIPHISEPTET